MANELALSALKSLYALSQDGRPSLGALSCRLGTTRAEAHAALAHLERRGLVDARRGRLTMRGLAAAASLMAREPERAEQAPTPRAAPLEGKIAV
jgi:DNA-binding MarR family transcriptional regulator